MELKLLPGLSALTEKIVGEEDTAIHYGSGNLKVFATPAMIALMENCAKSSVELHLPENYTTVGISVNVKHLRATNVNSKVKCEALLKEVDGRRLIFSVNVWDAKGKIGEGIHERFIVNSKSFMEKLNKDIEQDIL